MSDTPSKPKRFQIWPVMLTLWFIGFIAVCVWFVFRSFGMRHDLVTPDYYEEGLRHDVKVQALARSRKLPDPPRVDVDAANHRLIVYMPGTARGAVLTLYRASDAKMDRSYALQDGVPSVIDTPDVLPGRWQAQIRWEYEKELYFHRQDLYIP